MSRFVIDAPVLLRIADGAITPDPAHRLVAPARIRSDAMELLMQAVLAGELEERTALQTLDRIAEIRVRLLADRVSRRTAWKLALEHGWESTAQAEYLAVTRLQADALVTDDRDLRSKAQGVVPTAEVDALVRH